MSFKSAECWLLPTKSKSNIGTIMKCIKEMPYNDDTTLNKLTINKNWKVAETNGNKYWQPQHLYITINERPKVGDWYIVLLNGNIPALEQVKTINDNVWVNKELFETTRHIDNCFKIIACTDTLLSLKCDCGYIKKVNTGLCSGCGRFTNIPLMPTPSKSFIDKFIEKFNQKAPITDILVEYEDFYSKKDFVNGDDAISYQLKVNNNNEITIKKVNEKGEYIMNFVKDFIKEFPNENLEYLALRAETWIKSNL